MSELPEELLNILLEISNSLRPIYFWEDYTFWISLTSVIVLGFTLFWLIRYTRATEKMAEHQVTPAVDVNMIYEKSIGKTYFWFLNASSIPALVLIKFSINKNREGKIGPLRISPYHPQYPQFKKTATSFNFLDGDLSHETEVVLNITVTPAFDDNRIELKFTKSYRFDKSKFRWNETSWGYPDPSFPISKDSKNS